jgi:UrcA family protein
MMMSPIMMAVAAMLATSAVSGSPNLVAQSGPAIHVGYGDLDLSSAPGRARLVGRIQFAAERLCGQPAIESLDMRAKRAECFRIAVASGTEQMEAIARH